ncbi:hypothetical protein ABNF97_17990 [Plantactinospora sp. B6F1]|uniref:hypothetical protein n=1 Tax=Plantactinospora sp. B6F1 TaxID=3158971 RepID=UPI0032D8EFD5
MEQAALALYDDGSDVGPVDGPIRNAERHLGNWSGYTAEAFNTNYINRIPEVTRHQAFLARTLQHAMIANRDIFVEFRKDLKSTAETAITALEATTRSGGGKGAVVAFGVVAAVATVAAGAVTLGGATIAIASWTIIAGTSSGLSVAAGGFEEPRKTDLAADTVDQILSKMVDAVIEDLRQVDQQEKKIVTGLQNNIAALNGSRKGFLPNRAARSRCRSRSTASRCRTVGHRCPHRCPSAAPAGRLRPPG